MGITCHTKILCFFLIGTAVLCNKSKRYLVYPNKSAMGYILAVAVPTDLRNRHLYAAFNFEANYGLPNNGQFPTKILKTRIEGKREINYKNSTSTLLETDVDYTEHFTRRQFYKVVEQHYYRAGLNGTACLLKLICDVSNNGFHEHNGVLGSIIQILFMPSSSKNEYLPDAVYDAESIGKFERGTGTQCFDIYNTHCSLNILDFITEFH